MEARFYINHIPIGESHHPYIIAEVSANHNGKLENALRLISIAKTSGASACKIQTYTADTMTLDVPQSDFQIKEGLWKGQHLYDLYQQAYTPWEWHADLFEHAKKEKITLFSTPFDRSAVDLLENCNVPAYKIASFEAVDLPLIRYVASTKKPVILSTGMANEGEIAEAVQVIRDSSGNPPVLLHCISGYPAPASDFNLKTIADMKKKFGCKVGLSDHTLTNTTAVASVALGAVVVEKHFTLDRSAGGPDDSFSLEPQELKQLCEDLKNTWLSLGKVDYSLKESEKANLVFRRSLYVVENIKKGMPLTEKNMRSIRPGYGLPPKYYSDLLGKEVTCDIVRGTALTAKLIKNFHCSSP